MGLGSVNVPGGGSVTQSDLEQLKAEIMSGEITTPLCTAAGEEILTVGGDKILAFQDTSASALQTYVDKAVATAMAAVYASIDKAILAV